AHQPLTEALGTLPRETSYTQVALAGLAAADVKELGQDVTERGGAPAWGGGLGREASGNPFFPRGVLRHLAEEGAVERANAAAALGPGFLPDTVRQAIERRLARLSDGATRLLRVAAAFTGGIDFEVARRVAGLEEAEALDAVDETLGA